MCNLQITKGSDKQIAWATSIAQGWIDEVNRELDQVKIRNSEGHRLEKYQELLEIAAVKVVEGANSMTAAQIIDYNRMVNPGKRLIKQAQDAFNAQK